MLLLRRISTKWVVTVLAAVCIPFLGYAWYVDTQTAKRQWEVVRNYLRTMAYDLADRLDEELRERSNDIELQAAEPITEWTINPQTGDDDAMFVQLQSTFDKLIQKSEVYDLIVAIDKDGKFVVSNKSWPDRRPFPDDLRAALEKRDYSHEPWFVEAMARKRDDPRQVVLVDHHASPLLPPESTSSAPHPGNYHVGFAVPVRAQLDPDEVVGVVYALMNWKHVQFRILNRPGRPARDAGDDTTSDKIYRTSYAWLWMSDADTIIAHPTTSLYLKKVSQPPVDLPQLVAAARSEDAGFYPEYVFGGKPKNGAFKHCAGPAQGGLGWVVGVGIDNVDVTSFIEGLRSVLVKATLFALVVVLVLTVLVARRTTAPILELQRVTQQVAAGDLGARVAVKSRDELGDLGRAFNEMTHELEENRKKLIKAEKDAAWREMARQVAHEIKNPLTPIALSVQLLDRAKKEGSPELDSIFDRTVQLVTRQVEHMRHIASDFSAFAGARKTKPEVVEVATVLDEVLAECSAWAADARVTIARSGEVGASVLADKSELRRVFLNLVSNAIEAMPQGGKLDVRVERLVEDGARKVRVEVADSGVGLSDTVRARLFEPYFTTRSHGTGLGLAISARLVDDMGGTIELANRGDGEGPGAVARITLPERTR